MEFLNEKKVLNFYLERLEKNGVNFLKKKEKLKGEIESEIIKLRDEEEMHNRIEIAKELWKKLFTGAMSELDPDKGGYDELFSYFDKYVQFEELIFASDSFYRDHTLHCLWVYFLGEYIRNTKEFEALFTEFEENSGFYKLLQNIKKLAEKMQQENIGDREKSEDLKRIYLQYDKLIKHSESVRCLAALTHDLGYPLKKIGKINNSIKGILPYFSINNSKEYTFKYEDIQQNYIEELIRNICTEVTAELGFKLNHNEFKNNEVLRSIKEKLGGVIDNNNFLNLFDEEISLTNEELEFVVKYIEKKAYLPKNFEKELSYFRDFEEYNHGIMSAYLLSKTIKGFSRFGIDYSDEEELEISNTNVDNFLSKQDVLRAVSNHTNSNYIITGIFQTSDFLILIDEIEEFSRISRADMNREFVDEFCSSRIYMMDGYLNIDFVFDNEEIASLDPEFTFKGRCKRFLSIFNIGELHENLKIKLRCIGKIKSDNNIYELEIRRKFANIKINGEEKRIPNYLKSSEVYLKEDYMEI